MAKSKVEFNPALHKEKLYNVVKEASNAKLQIESFNTVIKDQREFARDELGVSPQLFNQLLRIYHNDQRDKFEETSQDVLDVYDSVFK